MVKIVYALLFIQKLRRLAEIYTGVKKGEVESLLVNSGDSNDQFAQQVAQSVQPILIQSGDVQRGLLRLEKDKEQRLVVNRVLNQFLNKTVVYAFGSVDEVNLQCGTFCRVRDFVDGLRTSAQQEVDQYKLQSLQLVEQNK